MIPSKLAGELRTTLGETFTQLYDVARPPEDHEACAFELKHMSLTADKWTGIRAAETWKEHEVHSTFFSHFADYCKGAKHLEDLDLTFGL